MTTEENVETNKETREITVYNFYDVMGILINEFKIEPECAPFFWDFMKVLLHNDPSLRTKIWLHSDMADVWETKSLIGEENIYIKGYVPVFTEHMVRATATEIKKQEDLFKEFSKHGFISFMEGDNHIRGEFGKKYNENEKSTE